MRIFLVLLFLLITFGISAKTVNFNYTFKDSTEKVKLFQFGKKLGPEIKQEVLLLLQGYRGNHQNNVAVFENKTKNLYKKINLDFSFQIGYGAEGCGIALLNTNVFTNYDSLKSIKWEDPRLKKSFSIGFDISDPPTSAIFDKYGNFYGRPEREISLNWNGMEIIKKLSPFEFRADPDKDSDFMKVNTEINYVPGGAYISLIIENHKIFDNYFIPTMKAYPCQLALGARSSERTTNVYFDDINLKFSDKIRKNIEPIDVDLIKNQPVFVKTRDTHFKVNFPKMKKIERVILTLKISHLPGGYDPWDEAGEIYIWKDSTRFELCRFITAYNRGYTWKVDVTDFLPLFSGEKNIDLSVSTWMKDYKDPQKQKGWDISAKLSFYKGNPKFVPFKIENIWNGNFEYGNQKDPMQNHLPEKIIDIPKGAKKAKLRIVVTGHGMSPNSRIAAEFMPANRTVFINKHKYENLLWKTDNYLNSCRPQGGTWKFDRAGWAPGCVVIPWEIDIPEDVIEKKKMRLNYVPMAYRNVDNSDCYKPHHIFESQIIFYK